MGVKAVVLSDLHLGAYASILCNQNPKNAPPEINLNLSINNAIDDLTNVLVNISKKGTGEPKIEELILLGDILDLILDQTEDGQGGYRDSRENIKSLFESFHKAGLDIGTVVYVPGNHDYGVWTDAVEKKNNKPYSKCTKTNYKVVNKAGNWDIDYNPLPDNLFQTYFLPKTTPYNAKVVYPFYHIRVENYFYMLHHGHLTSSLVLEAKKETKKARDVEELESLAYPIINMLWGASAKESSVKRHWRLIKEWGYMYPVGIYENIANAISSRIRPSQVGTYYKADSRGVDDVELKNIEWFIDLCKVPKLVTDTQAENINFHYVCGHTHYGGRIGASTQRCFINTEKGRKAINLWNTGGWICPEGIFPPYAFVFYINADGSPGRYLLLTRKFSTQQWHYDSSILKLHGMVKNYIR
jgi:hypothetical protein